MKISESIYQVGSACWMLGIGLVLGDMHHAKEIGVTVWGIGFIITTVIVIYSLIKKTQPQ